MCARRAISCRYASGLRRHVDALALGQAHIGLAPAVASAGALAERLGLAFDVDQVDRLDLDVEQRLDRRLDRRSCRRPLRLRTRTGSCSCQARALFRDVRRAHHVEQPLVRDARSCQPLLDLLDRIDGHQHVGRVDQTDRIHRRRHRPRRRAAGCAPTGTDSRSTSSVTISVATGIEILELRDQRLGVRACRPRTTSTIFRRPWRFSSDRIARIAPRYIFLLTFCAKLRGRAANVRPPPTKIGARSRRHDARRRPSGSWTSWSCR